MAIELGVHAAGALMGLAAGLVALLLTIVVLRAGGSRVNRRLALLLAADSAFMLGGFVSTIIVDPAGYSPMRVAVGLCVAFDAAALLLFLGTLDSPLGRALGRPAGTWITLGFAAGTVLVTLLGVVQHRNFLGFGNVEGPAWVFLAAASLGGLFVSLDAYRRTERGSVGHRRSGAAALAFVTRDLLTASFVVLWAVSNVRGWFVGQAIAEALGGISIALFVSLLTYGILRTQMFDIDLRVRWGIQKGTIIGVIIACAFVGEKLAENYLSREYGWVVGSVVAGLLVFAAPRLNRLGDKVAHTALPKVEPTPAYVHFKKLEVYKAAVESALENDGAIDERERAMLDRLRTKLAISETDARAIETEAAPSPPAPSTDAAPS